MLPLTATLLCEKMVTRRTKAAKPRTVNTPCGETDATLRDIAFVLHLTQKVKKEIVRDALAGVGG